MKNVLLGLKRGGLAGESSARATSTRIGGSLVLLGTVAILTSGCQGMRELVVNTPKEVNVAVAQKCIDRAKVPKTPEFPLDVVDLSDDKTALARLTNAATLEVKVRKEYVKQVEEVFKKCSN